MLSPGTLLGPYEILSAAGAGGMGEVYRARDTRLDRTVAIKVLAGNLTGRSDLLQRFEREARTISALNHPNICGLYDVGTYNGTPYLVMEYVEGETLAEQLTRGRFALADVWTIAIQIGEALDQAHRRGIVHRDLKPGNIMSTGSKHTVKLLDFGLAKLTRLPSAKASAAATSLLTVDPTVTAEGSIVGTMQYMAPEQLEGAEADYRSDIFAFGCVVYEMVTGRRAFEGKSHASLISAVMTSEPPSIQSLQPAAPPALDRLVQQCLAKDPDERWQSVADLVREIKWISQAGSRIGVAPAVSERRRTRLQASWMTVAALAVALAALLAVHLREDRPERTTVRFTVAPPENYSFRWSDMPVLSPDGKRLVFAAEAASGAVLFLRSLETTELRPLPGTEVQAEARYVRSPFWSPDGRYLAFFGEHALTKVDLTGGPAVTICLGRGLGGTWNRDGVILFGSAAGPVMRVSAAGGTPTPATKLDSAKGESGHRWPSFLPDGRHFLFTVTSTQPANGGVYVGSLDSSKVIRILNEETNTQYTPSGFLVFSRGDTLMAQRFDVHTLHTTGDAVPIAERAFPLRAAGFPVSGASFSVAAGSLAYRMGSQIADTQLIWMDRHGNRSAPFSQGGEYSNPALSPDGRIVAVGKRDPLTKQRDIWLLDTARGTETRFTLDPADDTNPVWSPDGQMVAFSSDRKGSRGLYVKPASGVKQEELLQSDFEWSLEDWTLDGRYLIFNRQRGRSLWAMPLFGDRKPFPLFPDVEPTLEGRVSPNGKWIAYTSGESGRNEIYVQNFPPAGGKWPVSIMGGRDAHWRPDGKELFYLQRTKLMAVDVKTDANSFERGSPRPLFDLPLLGNSSRNVFVTSADGQKFLVNARIESTALPIMWVLNAFTPLKP
jgi:Tol biopolymer transport system component